MGGHCPLWSFKCHDATSVLPSVITTEGFINLVYNRFFISWLPTIREMDHMWTTIRYIMEKPSALAFRIKDGLNFTSHSTCLKEA